jgi:hypothetical protein
LVGSDTEHYVHRIIHRYQKQVQEVAAMNAIPHPQLPEILSIAEIEDLPRMRPLNQVIFDKHVLPLLEKQLRRQERKKKTGNNKTNKKRVIGDGGSVSEGESLGGRYGAGRAGFARAVAAGLAESQLRSTKVPRQVISLTSNLPSTSPRLYPGAIVAAKLLLVSRQQKNKYSMRRVPRSTLNLRVLKESRYYQYLTTNRITTDATDAILRSIVMTLGRYFPNLDNILMIIKNYLRCRIKTVLLSPEDTVDFGNSSYRHIMVKFKNSFLKETKKHLLIWKSLKGFVLPLTDYRKLISYLFTIYYPGQTRITRAERDEVIQEFHNWNEEVKFPGRLIPLNLFLLWAKQFIVEIEKFRSRDLQEKQQNHQFLFKS